MKNHRTALETDMSASSILVAKPTSPASVSRLTQRASSRGASPIHVASSRLMIARNTRRVSKLAVVPVRAFLGFGKSKEEKAIEEFAASDLGKRALEHASRGGGLASMLEFGKKELEREHVPTDSHIIDAKTRVLCATLINKVVDVPIINEATEQIIALKAVDVVADHMEAELEKAGLATFFDGVRDMSEKDVDKWVKKVAERVNEAVDLPMLDETQEGIVIEMVVRLIAHKFVEGNKKREKKGWFGR